MSTALTPAAEIRQFLESERIQKELLEFSRGIFKPNDLVRLTVLATTSQPDIARCTKPSIIRALSHAASLQIEPSGVMGRGYLIPRKGKTGQLELFFDPGYRGLMDIALRSNPSIKMIVAHPVFENDHWDYDIRSEKIVPFHKPALKGRGKLIAAYAIADFKDGGQSKGEVLGEDDIAKVRASSAMRGGGPWAQWEERMAMKTAVRRLCYGLGFTSQELELAMRLAVEADAKEEVANVNVPVGDRVAAKITAAQQKQNGHDQSVASVIEADVEASDTPATPAPDISMGEDDEVSP